MSKVEIYTDGACKGNPGIGGWGALLIYNNNEKEIYGYELETTNNRMELTAVIKALETLNRNIPVEVTTDSNYVKNGITLWITNWRKNGWKTANKKEVKNKDLWLKLDLLNASFDIKYYWVKGHSGHIENEKADQLANYAIEHKLHS